MGNVQSSITQQVSTIVNQSMTELVTNNTNSASATNINGNNLSVDLSGAKLKNCPITFGQTIEADQTIKMMATFTSLNDLKSQMTTALQNTASQQNESKQGSLAIALNAQSGIVNIKQAISNLVSTKVTTNTFNQVNGFLQNINNGTIKMAGIEMDCGGAPLVITQRIISDQVVNMLTKAIVGTTAASISSSDAVTATSSGNKSVQQGLFEGIGGMMSSPGMIIFMVILALAVLWYIKSRMGN